MPTYEPLYTGTNDELQQDAQPALSWFREQILSVVDDDAKAYIKEHGWEAIRIVYHTRRAPSGWPKRQHVFGIKNPDTQYGDKPFTIRKDGTLHMVNLKHCIEAAIAKAKRDNQTRSVLGKTEEIWELHFGKIRYFDYARDSQYLGNYDSLRPHHDKPGVVKVRPSGYMDFFDVHIEDLDRFLIHTAEALHGLQQFVRE